MVRTDRGRDTGRDTRPAVGSWSHYLPSYRGFSRIAVLRTDGGADHEWRVAASTFAEVDVDLHPQPARAPSRGSYHQIKPNLI